MPCNYKFILVGDGPQKERLLKKAQELQVRDKVIFAGHTDEPEKYFSAINVLFFTSYANEGIPQSLLQARNVRLPMVVCRSKSVFEALENYEKVSFVDNGDKEAVKIAIERMAFNLKMNQRECYTDKWVRENYDIKNMLETLVGIYKKCGVRVPDISSGPVVRD
jgi:glycosyltransferase involved in cell wall biosynthesis